MAVVGACAARQSAPGFGEPTPLSGCLVFSKSCDLGETQSPYLCSEGEWPHGHQRVAMKCRASRGLVPGGHRGAVSTVRRSGHLSCTLTVLAFFFQVAATGRQPQTVVRTWMPSFFVYRSYAHLPRHQHI